ncbi:MAG: recombinase family protein [Eubacteriales bacterium]|nr:recombinase family protein [Eubacteriales bacterium]
MTGTKTAGRDDLKRLIADCRRGKIDRVLVKTVSRFARNTYDGLALARTLKGCGVSVYFQEEEIDTATMSDEFIYTMQSMAAQGESIAISQNMRWSCLRRMEDGTYLASNPAYGYRLENGEYVIIPEQAEIVRFIFNSFLSGKGKLKIVQELNAMNAPKRYGYKKWHISTINCILNNTRYMGDALLQKSYSTDDFPFRRQKNKGQKAQWYVENTNPPIISPEIYEVVQRLQEQKKTNAPGVGNKRVFSQKIICSCGHSFRYKQTNGISYWECRGHNLNIQSCPIVSIPESTICDAFLLLVNKLTVHREHILTPLIDQLERMQNRSGLAANKVYEIDKQIAMLTTKIHAFTQHRANGIMDAATFAAKSGAVNKQISELRTERRKLLAEDENDELLDELRGLDNILALTDLQTEFNGELFGKIITTVTAASAGTLRFRLLGGLELTETISYRKRR